MQYHYSTPMSLRLKHSKHTHTYHIAELFFSGTSFSIDHCETSIHQLMALGTEIKSTYVNMLKEQGSSCKCIESEKWICQWCRAFHYHDNMK